VLGGLSVSTHFVPFGSLMLTTVLIPRASFLGHLAGIIVGYAAAFGAFAWMTPFWTMSLGLWAVLGAHVPSTNKSTSATRDNASRAVHSAMFH